MLTFFIDKRMIAYIMTLAQLIAFAKKHKLRPEECELFASDRVKKTGAIKGYDGVDGFDAVGLGIVIIHQDYTKKEGI